MKRNDSKYKEWKKQQQFLKQKKQTRQAKYTKKKKTKIQKDLRLTSKVKNQVQLCIKVVNAPEVFGLAEVGHRDKLLGFLNPFGFYSPPLAA